MRAFDALVRGISELLAILCMLAVAFVAVGISADVLGRTLGIGVLPWILEASEYVLMVLTFGGAAWVLLLNEHVRVDVLVTALPQRIRQRLAFLSNLVGLAISAILTFVAGRVALTARAEGMLVMKEFVFPEWWIYGGVAASCVLLCLVFVHRLLRQGQP